MRVLSATERSVRGARRCVTAAVATADGKLPGNSERAGGHCPTHADAATVNTSADPRNDGTTKVARWGGAIALRWIVEGSGRSYSGRGAVNGNGCF